jgi:hypothetical protein
MHKYAAVVIAGLRGLQCDADLAVDGRRMQHLWPEFDDRLQSKKYSVVVTYFDVILCFMKQ